MTDAVEDVGHLPHPSKVEAMAGYGLTAGQIARVLKVDPEVLKATYADQLEGGQILANAKVAESLYRKATGEGREAVTAAIFWLKARARWKETSITEHGGIPGQPIEQITRIENIIVSPPNREELSKMPGLAINQYPNWPNGSQR